MELIKIAHRGNRSGRKVEWENNPLYLSEAIEAGYYCEVDVWFLNDRYYLGHDEAEYPVDESDLENENFICHAKNIEALHQMLKKPNIHCFFHDKDYCTLTSRNWVWKYPEVYFEGKLIALCSDWL